MIEIKDFYQVGLPAEYHNLDKSEKISLIDKAVSNKKGGLSITLELTAAGKRINNRIYTPRGINAGLETWTKPFPKPVIKNHDKNQDPLGRFKEVWYEDTAQKNLNYFKSTKDWREMMDAFEADDPKRIVRSLQKNGLLLNQKWPGVGKTYSKLIISDEAAIEKFLDQRYLTFSQGSTTDRMACGVCGFDWATGDICDHRPGSIDSDSGLPVVFVTGIKKGKEISIVTDPANDTSFVLSMELVDKAITDGISLDKESFKSDEIYLTDSILTFGEPMNLVERIKELDYASIKNFVEEIAQDKYTEQLDSLGGETFTEVKVLIGIHDALHSMYDWSLKYREEKDLDVPRSVFKLHGKLHEMAVSQGFRDDFVNGPLDGFDASGHKADLYVYKDSANESLSQENNMQITDELINQIVEQVAARLAAKPAPEGDKNVQDTAGTGQENKENKEEEVADEEVQGKVSEPVTSESSFNDERVDAIFAWIKEQKDKENQGSLAEDYAVALKEIETLKDTLKNLEEKNSETLDNKNEEVDTIDKGGQVEAPDIGVSDNQNGSSNKLDSYHQGIVNRFTKIKDTQGEEAAEMYLNSLKMKGLIKPNFNI